MPITHLRDLNVIIGEGSEQSRTALTAMLRQQGVRNVRASRDLPRMRQELNEHAADLIVISTDLDENVFREVKNLRRHTYGINPFAVIAFMAEPSNKDHLKQATGSGADDVMARPVSPGKIMERAKQVAYNRLPFVAMADYVGPDRRPAERQRQYKPFEVLNSLKHKMDGKKLPHDKLLTMIERDMRRVRSSQLDGFGWHLDQACKEIPKAYESEQVDESVQKRLKVVYTSLKQAGLTARELGEQKLTTVCESFEKQVRSMAENYHMPSPQQLDLIGKLHTAFNQVRT